MKLSLSEKIFIMGMIVFWLTIFLLIAAAHSEPGWQWIEG